MTVLSYGHDVARTNHLVPGLSSLTRVLTFVGDVIREIRWTFATGLTLQANYQKLAAMSDAELAKLGLSREEIPTVVVAPLKLL